MSVNRRMRFNRLLLTTTITASLLLFISIMHQQPALPQSGSIKSAHATFVAEPGCPVELTARPRAEFELDESGTPFSAREYLEFRNISEKPITNITFRFGFVDDTGMMSVFHGSDQRKLDAGATATQKWRTDVRPNTRAIKIRIMGVNFEDGSSWESSKSSGSVSPESNPLPQLPPPTLHAKERAETVETTARPTSDQRRTPDKHHGRSQPHNELNEANRSGSAASESSADVEMLPPPAPVPEEPFVI